MNPTKPATPDPGTPVVSLRDRIGKSPQVAKELLTIPEWDVTLEVRGITLGQRSRIHSEGYTITADEKPRPKFEVFYPLLLMFSCYDPTTGDPVFSGPEADVMTFVNGLNPGVVDRVARVGMRLSGLSAEGAEKNAGDSKASGT